MPKDAPLRIGGGVFAGEVGKVVCKGPGLITGAPPIFVSSKFTSVSW